MGWQLVPVRLESHCVRGLGRCQLHKDEALDFRGCVLQLRGREPPTSVSSIPLAMLIVRGKEEVCPPSPRMLNAAHPGLNTRLDKQVLAAFSLVSLIVIHQRDFPVRV